MHQRGTAENVDETHPGRITRQNGLEQGFFPAIKGEGYPRGASSLVFLILVNSGQPGKKYYRSIPIARAASTTRTISDTVTWQIITSFAVRESTMVSVGPTVLEVWNDRNR